MVLVSTVCICMHVRAVSLDDMVICTVNVEFFKTEDDGLCTKYDVLVAGRGETAHPSAAEFHAEFHAATHQERCPDKERMRTLMCM